MVGAVCDECGARKKPLYSNAVSAAEFGPELVGYGPCPKGCDKPKPPAPKAEE